jgi:choline kinase
MRAIILAAGLGKRLHPLTANRPKCLVDFGNGAILDHQIDAMLALGVEDFVIVVGYQADQVIVHCTNKLRDRPESARVRFVENTDYDRTNSLYSLFLAQHELDTDLFLLNCDIVFHTEIARRLVEIDRPNVIAVDLKAPRPVGEMGVRLTAQDGVEDCVGAISKQLDPATSHGLSAQVARFCSSGARTLAAEVERVAAQGGQLFPTSAYGPLIAARQLFAVDVSDLPWAEIDSIEDYEHAIEHALPRMHPSAP